MGGETDTKSTSNVTIPRYCTAPVGQQIHNIYKDRIKAFNAHGQYESAYLQGSMYEGRATGEDHVKLSVYSPPGLSRPSFEDATSHEFKNTSVGQWFGPSWSTHWLKVQLRVPSELQTKEHLELHWDAGNEGLIWTEDGEPIQGLTGGERIEWIIPDTFRDGTFHTIYIEMACNGMFGNGDGGTIMPPNPNRYFQLHKADIVAINLEARQLFIDFWIVGDAAREFPDNSWESHKALQIENQIMDEFIAGNGSKEAIIKCRQMAREYTGNVDSADVYKSEKEAIVYAVGNCHIDTCWLWPWAETKRKVARSWSNQCDLIERYPELRFVASQAQQFKWLEHIYPKLYDRVKSKVKMGHFQPIGGSWVEHDTNLPSGESLVRQFLYGQRFFESHFGERCRTFWLPDTFGYSSQLPQLCRLAGMTRFFTQKLSWNNINTFPHTTFNWVSLDGSQVMCHMAPSETYTAAAHFGDVKRSVTQHKSLDQDATSLLMYGKGDGGGGPTWEQIEKLRRCRGISDNVGLLPRVKSGDSASVEDFFDRLEKRATEGTKFVTWYGELYFEFHRGTYTSQANNKYNNRKSEIMLHDLEYLATLATLKDRKYKYPKKDIDNMWENVLLCQFHDCLPGSSIEMVYHDSRELYQHIFDSGEKLMKEALSTLGFSTQPVNRENLASINTAPWPRGEIVKLPEHLATEGSEFALVKGQNGLASVETLTKKSNMSSASIKEIKKGVFIMTNSQYMVQVESGNITSLYDIAADREVLASGAVANQLVMFDDKPLSWQAWDVEVYHLESRRELPPGKTVIVEDGPHRVSLVTETQISAESWIKTTMSLAATVEDQPSYIEMACEVEWHEKWKILKVEFPVDVKNTEASYETQYGIVRRPTHYNTSWDMAKFEVCCHKWADLSENGYGVSILNDSKYGFATSGNMMRLSLLRAPKAPDAHADMGHHHIRYAILPHSGPLDSRTVRTAFNFNHPFKIMSTPGVSSATDSLLRSISLTGSEALVLDCIKRGEDDDDVSRGELPKRKGKSIILRIYESLGGRARGAIKCGLNVKKLRLSNLLEDDGKELEWKDGEAKIELRAFEVKTYRLQL